MATLGFSMNPHIYNLSRFVRYPTLRYTKMHCAITVERKSYVYMKWILSCIPYWTVVRRWSTISYGWMFDERANEQCTGWPHCFTTELPVFIADWWMHFYLVDGCSPVRHAININVCDGNKTRLISLLLRGEHASESYGDNMHGETNTGFRDIY